MLVLLCSACTATVVPATGAPDASLGTDAQALGDAQTPGDAPAVNDAPIGADVLAPQDVPVITDTPGACCHVVRASAPSAPGDTWATTRPAWS